MKPGTYKGLEGKDFTVTSLGSWKSPHTSIKYPQGWAIKLGVFRRRVSSEARIPYDDFNEMHVG